MLVMNNSRRWLPIFRVTIATAERERQFTPGKMGKKLVDQQVLRVNLEARLGRIQERMILKVFLASRTCKDLMKTINNKSKAVH